MIAVVHLVGPPWDPERLRTFLASYRTHQAGTEHELVVLVNGGTPQQRQALEGELEGVEHQLIVDEPVDLAAYLQAAKRLPHDRLCFLNSHSVILAQDWLAKLAHALDQPGAGLVGATGSWESVRSVALNSLFLPNAYRGAIPKGSLARGEMTDLLYELESLRSQSQASANSALPAATRWRSAAVTLRSLPAMPRQVLRFPPFPAYHVRTNAFMLRRSTFRAMQIGAIRGRTDAYFLESGRRSITRQILGHELRALVVDRHGNFYDHTVWPHSHTFRQGDQEGLLIADNQTRAYAKGGLELRRLLSAITWGSHAEPRAKRAPPS